MACDLKAASLPSVTLPLGLAAVASCVFFALTACVLAGRTSGFDHAGLLALRDATNPNHPLGPGWLQASGRDFTALGSNGVLGALVLAAAMLLALARRRNAAFYLVATFLGALVLQGAIKIIIARPRPDLVPHAARVFTSSFPSSHATISAAVALSAAALLERARGERRFTIVAATIAGLLVLLVGASRLYLGVHWPTDVLAGWSLGVAWSGLLWAGLRRWS